MHSLREELTDSNRKRALLALDITNAFNSCDRARVLRELYDTPQLSSLYRLADFGYSVPSVLLLEGCDGLSIPSTNGVRQGDPLSALLFCVYLHKILQQVAEQTNVRIYAYSDNINATGTPDELMNALAALKEQLRRGVAGVQYVEIAFCLLSYRGRAATPQYQRNAGAGQHSDP